MLPTVVLIVDDEASFIEMMTKTLGERKLIVEGAGSGREALERLEGNPYIDVVVLDVQLPDMDGIEALQQIKGARPLVEIIMLTEQNTTRIALDGMRLGAFDYLMRPCNIEDLAAKLEEAKIKKRSHEEKIQEAKVRNIIRRRGY